MSGYVYFITCEPDQYVKIGWSLRNPIGRMNTLQTGCPEALRLMAFFPGSQEDERQLHHTFEELRYRGEWFINQYKLLDLIRYLSDGYPRETISGASREVFEAATWDVIITGFEHPSMDEEYLHLYRKSGAGRLWHHLHPDEVLS